MSEQHQHNDSLPKVEAEQDVVVLVKKLQQQIVFLEKKIDILISQSQEKSSEERYASKPYRSFTPSYRRDSNDRGGQDRGPRDRDSSGGGRNFDRPHAKREYGNSSGDRDRGFSHGSRFEKRPGSESRGGFDPKKKPFYPRRRESGR